MNRCAEYSEITESRGQKASKEQIQRLFQRYRFAVDYIKDKDVLEAACGTGIGLGYLKKTAKTVAGIDIDEKNLGEAIRHNTGAIIRRMNAEGMSFADGSFDAVLMYEALYYLKEPERFVEEAHRVLRKNGVLIISTVNKDWEDFHPSPYSTRYFSAPELYALLKERFKEVNLFAGFRADKKGVRKKAVSAIKRVAVNLNLMPGSLKARAHLKRLFMGRLTALPHEVFDNMAEYAVPEPISHKTPNADFKILYAVAGKNGQGLKP